MRAFRARRRAEVAEAKRVAKEAAKHQYWLNYKAKHPKTRVNKPKPSVAIDGKKFVIPPATLEAWYAPDLSYEEALAFVKAEIVPAQPEIAGEIVDAVQRGCYQTNLARNRFTLHRNGVANAQIQRALVYQQDAEVPFAGSRRHCCSPDESRSSNREPVATLARRIPAFHGQGREHPQGHPGRSVRDATNALGIQ